MVPSWRMRRLLSPLRRFSIKTTSNPYCSMMWYELFAGRQPMTGSPLWSWTWRISPVRRQVRPSRSVRRLRSFKTRANPWLHPAISTLKRIICWHRKRTTFCCTPRGACSLRDSLCIALTCAPFSKKSGSRCMCSAQERVSQRSSPIFVTICQKTNARSWHVGWAGCGPPIPSLPRQVASCPRVTWIALSPALASDSRPRITTWLRPCWPAVGSMRWLTTPRWKRRWPSGLVWRTKTATLN